MAVSPLRAKTRAVSMRILLIEDDQEAARLLAKGLREEGWVVDIAHSGGVGDEMASVNTYDVIVIHSMLPDRDGVAVCRSLRASGLQAPILMLTARDGIEDRVLGLNAGTDDYLTKPFAFAELLARLHALLRRSELTRRFSSPSRTSRSILSAIRSCEEAYPSV